MKLLAIHSSQILLRKNTVNAYNYLAGERHRMNEFEALDEEYQRNKEEGPLLLRETFELVSDGMTLEEFDKNCEGFWMEFQDENIEANLKKVRSKFELIYIFTSYPASVYKELQNKGLVDEIIGVPYRLEGNLISGMGDLRFENEALIKEKLAEIGLKDKFTYEANRYGLLAALIDRMTKLNLEKEDVTVMGSQVTARPLYKVSHKRVENFEELFNS